MSYITKVISSQEKLISIKRVHWIYAAQGVFWLALLSAMGFAAEYYLYHYAGIKALDFKMDLGWVHFNARHTPIPWIMTAAGVAVFWPLFLVYISTEIGLTDTRIIHKKGLILIQVQQADLEDVRAENVNHGWFGWLLGYGRIHLDCRFVDDIYLPAMPKPYDFVRASHVARMKHPDIEYGKEDLKQNINALDEQKNQAQARVKLKVLADKFSSNFRKAA